MNLTIPQPLQTRLRKHVRDFDVSADEYVKAALERALKEDDELAAEMQMWEAASISDFIAFAREHKL